jgi:hypothetical protein
MRILAALAISTASLSLAQYSGLSLPPSGNNQKASVTQYIGPVKVTIDYSSPKVGDRRGKIWGTLVPYGMRNLGFGTAKESPWRAGANENTVFTVSDAVRIQGKMLPAGSYGLHMIPQEKEDWTIIFSKNYTSWGSFFYDAKEDALRITAKPSKHEFRDYLTYEFTDRDQQLAKAELQWEDLSIGWTIEVPDPDSIYISKLSEELRSATGFSHQAFVNAAMYTVQANKHLDLGLEWADAAISRPFIGVRDFQTLSTKSRVLMAMEKKDEAKVLLLEAVKHPAAGPMQIHQVGRQLQQSGFHKEALEVYEINHSRNGDKWPVHVGLARGYMGVGESAKALDHAKKALEQAPDDVNKRNLSAMVQALTEGKKFNN